MGILNKLSRDNNNYGVYNTKGFSIGVPEAEGEAASKIKLPTVFGDFLNVFESLKSEKFIIEGRKGSGKTAIAEMLIWESQNNSGSTFSDFIKTKELNLEMLLQIKSDRNFSLQVSLLFEWVILIKMTKLILQNCNLEKEKNVKLLQYFLSKNAGYVNINNLNITEVIKSNGFDVSIEHLKRYFSAKLHRDVQIKSEKAHFSQVINPLKEIILDLLLADTNKDNEYLLLFDDLDIGFDANDEQSIQNLSHLIRTVKEYNIDFFTRNNLNGKIILLLRDDIRRIICSRTADMAKIFSSYSIPLNWYNQDIYNISENDLPLKKFINKRIEKNFELNGLQMKYRLDPWRSLIEDSADSEYSYLTYFRNVIEITFLRPRDLITFFSPLATLGFKIPLTTKNIKTLTDKFADNVIVEIKAELSAIYKSLQIEAIFNALKTFKAKQNFSFEEFTNALQMYDSGLNAFNVANELFEYSLIGNCRFDSSNKLINTFKYRAKIEETITLNIEQAFVLKNTLKRHFNKPGN